MFHGCRVDYSSTVALLTRFACSVSWFLISNPGASGLDPFGVFAAGSVHRVHFLISFVYWFYRPFIHISFLAITPTVMVFFSRHGMAFREWEGCDLVSLFSHFHFHFYRSFH